MINLTSISPSWLDRVIFNFCNLLFVSQVYLSDQPSWVISVTCPESLRLTVPGEPGRVNPESQADKPRAGIGNCVA